MLSLNGRQGSASSAEVEKCLICGGENVEVKNAIVTDFVSERIWGEGSKKKTRMIHCKNCGFAFYELRFSDDEASKLYDDYRGVKYLAQRQRDQPWWTKEINNAVGFDEQERAERGAHLDKMLKNCGVDESAVNAVLDYGGDRGQYIPDYLTNAKKYVIDISTLPPEGRRNNRVV